MATHLPAELLQQVYTYLGPQDFSRARRSCIDWQRAAICSQTLNLMAERSSWSACLDQSDGLVPERLHHAQQLLARESRLADSFESTEAISKYEDGLFELAATMDFVSLDQAAKDKYGATAAFSIDTGYLLVTHGATIFVYRLDASSPSSFLNPVAAIKCPRRVLQATMDSSGSRHSVAALLDGRSACICHLDDGSASMPQPVRTEDTAVRGRLSSDNVNVVQVDSTHQSVVLYNAGFERDMTQAAERHESQSHRAAEVDTTETS
ncbi:MAG: hypothetical protein Q9159_000784 [Coniocarpon cinnabarinum]